MELRVNDILLAGSAAIAGFQSIRYRKIPNVTVACISISALLAAAAQAGAWGVYEAAVGGVVGAGLLIPGFALGKVSGGVVKLTGAIGLFGGQAIVCLALAFAGVLSALYMLVRVSLRGKTVRGLILIPVIALTNPEVGGVLLDARQQVPFGFYVSVGSVGATILGRFLGL